MKLLAFERKILAGVAVAFVASLVVAFALYRSAAEVNLTEQEVEHTTQVLDGVDDLLQSLVDLNFAWSGYHLTRDEGLSPRFDEFKESISSQSDKIRILTAENAVQQQRIALLRSAAEGVFKSMSEAVNVRRASGDDAMKASIAAQQAKEHLEEVQSAVRQIKQAELELFHTRFAARKGSG